MNFFNQNIGSYVSFLGDLIMELWIRSQNKRTLIQPNRIDIDGKGIVVWQNNYNCDETYLGSYKTKKRALEVLDEIQQILTPKMVYKNITEDKAGIEEINQYFSNNVHFNTSNNADIHFINNTYVYEMPEE